MLAASRLTDRHIILPTCYFCPGLSLIGDPSLLEGARGLAHRAPHGDWHTVHRTGIGTSCTARGLGHRAPHGKELYSVHST